MTMTTGTLHRSLKSFRVQSPACTRDEIGTPAPKNPLSDEQIVDADEADGLRSKRAHGFSTFGALQVDDGPPIVDENEDFGGLMVRQVLHIA